MGDALGAALSQHSGRARPRQRELGSRAVTDETELALFTAEGLVLATRDPSLAGSSGVVRSVHRAYLRWLKTQGEHSSHPSFGRTTEGWLLGRPELHSRRGSGAAWVDALRGRRMGRVEQPLNSSMDGRGLARFAAVGLCPGIDDPFAAAREISGLTHGHPSACLAAGFVALAVREAAAGTPLAAACVEALEELRRYPGCEECQASVARALGLLKGGRVTAECLSSLAPARAAPEMLATALAGALAVPDFESSLSLAASCEGHGSTAAGLVGSLLGAAFGDEVIPRTWLERLELRDAIEVTVEELCRAG